MRALALLLMLTAASGARAQSVDHCAASFPARLQDARAALVAWGAEHERYVEARPLVAYFEAHCRFLSDRELAARKLDDANAFACDAPKPKGLTAELVLRYSVEPSIGTHQEHAGDDARCLEQDRATRVALVFTGEQDRDDLGHRLLVMCYGDYRPRCKDARAMVAKP